MRRSESSQSVSSSEYGVIEETSLKGTGTKIGMSASPSCSEVLSVELTADDGAHSSKAGFHSSARGVGMNRIPRVDRPELGLLDKKLHALEVNLSRKNLLRHGVGVFTRE